MNYFKSLKHSAAVGLALIAMSGSAFAQTANSNSNSTSGANSASGSSSSARSTTGPSTSAVNASQQQGVTSNTSTGVTLN